MRRIGSILLMIVFLGAPARAENFFDKLGRELDRFGENVGRELQGALNRPAARRVQKTGLCVTYNGQGIKTDEKRCVQVTTCSSQQRCTFVHRWPSGLKTVVDIVRGREPRMNGKNAFHSAMGDVFCVTSLITTNRFCFVKPGQRRVPRVVDAFNPGGEQPQSGEEHLGKLGLITDMMTTQEVDQFFRDLTLDQLTPVNALRECQDELLARALKITSPVPLEAKARSQQVCATGAERYGQRLVRELSDQRIAETKAKPATLLGLRDHHWYGLQSSLSSFTAQQRAKLLRRYDDGIRVHRSTAIANAHAEIRQAFHAATPLTESGDVALKLCYLKGNPPTELLQTCKQQSDQFNKKVQAVRCNRAIAASGATRDMLDMPVQVAGTGYQSWPVRKVICTGIEKMPNYRITVGNGSIPFLTTPSLQIYEGENVKVLDVEFRVASPRDGRSFGKLLLDIATGENEREVPEVLVVERIVYAGKGLKWHDDRAAIGCVLNFIKCQ